MTAGEPTTSGVGPCHAVDVTGVGAILVADKVAGLPPPAAYGAAAAVLFVVVVVASLLGRRLGRRAIAQRLTALGTRLSIDPPEDDTSIETALAYLEQVTGAATQAVAESSADAIRLRRSLDTLPQGVVVCDEDGVVVYRNPRANSLMTSRHGDVLAAQAVTELLEDAWHEGTAERTLDLYGPPRRTLAVRTRLIDDGRRALGVIAVINDVSERRRLEEIRRDFVANVSHELKTPIGALGLLAETLVSEPDADVAQRLASRIHTEAFRVSRIIDDLLDLSRIESEEAPPREPVSVNLVMAEAVERVRAAADQRGIRIELVEPDPPVAVYGDRRQLVSAMHALLENAVTYSYDGSSVTVSASVTQESADGQDGNAATGSVPATVGTTASASTASPPVPSMPPVAPLPAPAPDGPVLAPATPQSPKAIRRPAPGPAPTTTPFGTPAIPAAPAAPESAVHSAGDGGTGPRPEPGAAAPVVAPFDAVAFGAAPYDAEQDGGGEAGGPGAADVPGSPPAASTGTQVRPDDTSAARNDSGTRVTPRELVRLSVIDSGVGIPARDLDRIFERFYRVDHGRSRDTGGTGLGLSIARHVANNHQGWVEVESREGEGSTFTLVLPVQATRVA
jgi:two-component system sensor histidine kinase SenX3